MKKIYVVVMVAIMILGMGFKAQAIENPWREGTIVANAHVGFFPGIGGSVSADYVLINSWWKGHFTIGGYVGFDNVIVNSYHNYASHDISINFMPRATYGLNITKDFEVHAGVMTGLCYGYNRWRNFDLHTSGRSDGYIDYLYVPLFVGCHYFFTPNFGVSAEVMCYSNYYVPYLNAGITLKF